VNEGPRVIVDGITRNSEIESQGEFHALAFQPGPTPAQLYLIAFNEYVNEATPLFALTRRQAGRIRPTDPQSTHRSG
jgi:hypothetical protein